MEEKYRVALKNFKKVITIQPGITSLEELHEKIALAFKNCPIFKEPFQVQYFDEDFDEFVDLDYVSSLACVIDKRYASLFCMCSTYC